VREISTLKQRNRAVPAVPPDLFKGLPPDFLREIEERSKVRDFEKGHVFFKTGQNGQGLFMLDKGGGADLPHIRRKKLIIADLKAPAIFREMGCVGGCLYHCRVRGGSQRICYKNISRIRWHCFAVQWINMLIPRMNRRKRANDPPMASWIC
jgi:hypothetical protein